MSEEKKDKKAEQTAETVLAPQLGSDMNTLLQGKVDIERLTNIDEIERLWLSYLPLIPKHRGGDFLKKFCTRYANLSMAKGGKRATQLIQALGAAKGVSTTEVKRPPGWISRNVTDRKWKKKAEAEGKAYE